MPLITGSPVDQCCRFVPATKMDRFVFEQPRGRSRAEPYLPKPPRKKGKLRNPPKAKQYALYAIVIVIVVAAGSGIYLYALNTPGLLGKGPSGSTTSSVTLPANQTVYALINTTQGSMEAQLFPNVAPKTVANFVSLANSGFYNNLVWHRIVKGFAIQTGDPTTRNGGGNQATWGQTGSNQTVPLETNQTVVNEGYVNSDGYLAMARTSDPNSGSSQFYINLGNNTSLNGQYTVFGKVISGLNVATAIGNLPVNAACQSSGGTSCQPSNPTQAEVTSITIRNSP